eukprot:5949088-Pleurochrysis_carterae.AAC.1
MATAAAFGPSNSSTVLQSACHSSTFLWVRVRACVRACVKARMRSYVKDRMPSLSLIAGKLELGPGPAPVRGSLS